MAAPHVLILGAGVTGLLLAQALRKHDIPYTLFERDATHREQGWGLAFHWAFPTLQALMPKDLAARLPETYCIPTSTEEGEPGHYPFIDLQTGNVKWALPPGLRRRVVRRKLCRLLETDVNIVRGRRLVNIARSKDHTITAYFEDGSTAVGTHVVGCDGTGSTVRRILCDSIQSQSRPRALPVRLLGANVVFSGETGRKMQKLDRAFCQGGDSSTDAFMLFAIQDTPENNERDMRDTYLCQVVISWPFRAGFLGEREPVEVPSEMTERVELMRRIAKDWASPLRDIIYEVPLDTAVHPITLQDWVPAVDTWDNMHGRATLIGDAAHPMTMYRGEAANHGVTDVGSWLKCHLAALKSSVQDEKAMKAACERYETEMVNRAAPAVLASRQACLDAHNSRGGIDGDSPLVSKRKVNV